MSPKTLAADTDSLRIAANILYGRVEAAILEQPFRTDTDLYVSLNQSRATLLRVLSTLEEGH